jgi:hypothetical protein
MTFAQGVLQLIRQASEESFAASSLKPREPVDTPPLLYIHLILSTRGNSIVSRTAIDVSGSDEILYTLWNVYHKHRGALRNIFSVFRFSHFETVKVRGPELPVEQVSSVFADPSCSAK